MSKFKVGDIVKRIDGDWNGMEVGDIAKITNIDSCGGLELGAFKDGHGQGHFQLVDTFIGKIKFYLIKLNKSLVFQVLDMNSLFSSGSSYFSSKRNLKIVSINFPELQLRYNSIALYGSNAKRNNDICGYQFSDDKERDEFAERIILAIREWALLWDGWGEEVLGEIKDVDFDAQLFEF